MFMIHLGQVGQIMDRMIANINYEDKIRSKYTFLSDEQLRRIVSDYRNRNFLVRFFDPVESIPEYRIAKELLQQRKN